MSDTNNVKNGRESKKPRNNSPPTKIFKIQPQHGWQTQEISVTAFNEELNKTRNALSSFHTSAETKKLPSIKPHHSQQTKHSLSLHRLLSKRMLLDRACKQESENDNRKGIHPTTPLTKPVSTEVKNEQINLTSVLRKKLIPPKAFNTHTHLPRIPTPPTRDKLTTNQNSVFFRKRSSLYLTNKKLPSRQNSSSENSPNRSETTSPITVNNR